MKKFIILIVILILPVLAYPAQYDYNVQLQPQKFTRKLEINPAFSAIVSQNSGATDPGVNLINPSTFSGAGLNDATSGGTFSGTDDELYEIVIDGTGTPNTFKWRKLCRDNVACPFLSSTNITGATQALSEGVTVTFGATTGHTFNDQWDIFAHKGKTYPYMYWADTANDLLKQRNAGDTAWISLWTLSTGVPSAGGSVPGIDSVGTSELNDGADSPLAGQCVVVDAVDNTKFEYIPCPSGGGDSVSVDGAATVDPNFADTGDINFTNTANVISGDVQANSVALGTDTTGGYAASTTEGGPATTATALDANGGNCAAGSYPLGVDTLGAIEGCTDATTEIDSAILTHKNIASAHHTATVDTDTQLTQEQVEDFAGPLIATGGTKTRVTVTYQDATNDFDIVADNMNQTECATSGCALNTATTAVDEAYNATTWDLNNEIPTKNAIRDKIEALPGGHAAVTLSGTGTYLTLTTQDIQVDPITESDISDLVHTTDTTLNLAGVETITGNWVNTTNPWADNEVDDALTIAGGSVTNTTNITLEEQGAADPTIDGRIEWDTTTETLKIGDDAVGTWEFFPNAHTVDTNTQLSQEQVEDFAGALIGDGTGTHTGITITYQDATGDVDFVVDHDAATNFVANEHIDHTSVTLTAGAGIGGGGDISANRSFTTASQEANFLADGGVTALTCGASNQGKMQVMDDGTLQACDGAVTSIQQTFTPGAHTGLPATADISDVAVTQTELAELETIGATVISAGNWTAVAALAGTNTGDDDIPEAGDFGNATDLDANGAVVANGVALTTDTTGNYVGTVAAGTGITIAEADGEGVTKTVVATLGTAIDSTEITDGVVNFPDIDFTNTLAGNPTLAVDECFFFSDLSGGGFLCEGSTADTSEQLYRFPNLNGVDTTQYFVIADNELVTPTEVGYLDGVTSAIQTQLNAKEGTLTNEAGLYSALSDVTNFLQTGDALAGGDITAGSISATELATDSVGELELIESMAFTAAGDWNFGGGGIEIENGITPPACTVGQVFLDTDATAGQQLMACEGGTFVTQGDGGGVTNTADIADVAVTQTELAELETIGTTVISAGNWTGLSNLSGTNTGDDDIPESGDFGNGADLETTGAISVDAINLSKLNDGSDTPAVGEALFVAAGGTTLEYKPIQEHMCIPISDETTAITTGTAKVTIRMPYAFTVTDARASVNTASSSGLPTFDINESGTTILSTKITIDASEKTSETAATARVISDTTLADDAEMTFDIDVAGTGAKGAKICLIGNQ